MQGPNLEFTLLSRSNNNKNNNNKNNHKNPHLNFLRDSYLVSGMKLTRAMAKLGVNFDNYALALTGV